MTSFVYSWSCWLDRNRSPRIAPTHSGVRDSPNLEVGQAKLSLKWSRNSNATHLYTWFTVELSLVVDESHDGREPRWLLGRWNILIKEEIATDHHQPCRVRITCEENALQKRIGNNKLRPLLPGALIRGWKMHRHQGDGVGPCTSNRRKLRRTVTFQNATKMNLPRYEKVRRVRHSSSFDYEAQKHKTNRCISRISAKSLTCCRSFKNVF